MTAQKVKDLFVRGRQEDTLKVSMEDLPDTQNPDSRKKTRGRMQTDGE
jgi:hypothetical protein